MFWKSRSKASRVPSSWRIWLGKPKSSAASGSWRRLRMTSRLLTRPSPLVSSLANNLLSLASVSNDNAPSLRRGCSSAGATCFAGAPPSPIIARSLAEISAAARASSPNGASRCSAS